MCKPLQINPLKLSQPMGALLAFLGIKNCMPLMHGAQGCASFSKVFFTRHFNDPIAIQTTAVNDITAVIDGGDKSICEAIDNITKKVKPDIVGLFTTGLTETKGDDIKGATYLLKEKQKMVYAHTPDFEGGLESGWQKSVLAIIEQLVKEKNSIDYSKALLLPNVNLTPIEVEKIKEQIALFGYEVFALPDLSLSLDGHLGIKQGALSSGGIPLEEIENLADCSMVISVGDSMEICGKKMLEKNSNIQQLHFSTLSGLLNIDQFYASLLEHKELSKPNPSIARWRKRYQDALLDTHFLLGGKRALIALEADHAKSVIETISQTGVIVDTLILPHKNPQIQSLQVQNIIVGDFEDVENALKNVDFLVTNFHGERLAHKYHKPIILRGFPDYETVGNQLKNDTLYEGGCNFLFEIANKLI